MDIQPITETLSVSAQISPEDVAALKAAGYAAIICNRPDGEEAGQPTFAQIEAAANDNGLNAITIPIGPGGASDTDIMAFADALANVSGPVHAYCRSGTRSTMLWGLSQVGRMPASEIIARARAAGYDLSALAPRLAG